MPEYKIVHGDLFQYIDYYTDKKNIVIPHVVNCKKVMNAGFAKTLRKKYPKSYYTYMMHFNNVDDTFGDICAYQEEDGIFIAHMYAQKTVRNYFNPTPLSYDALFRCLTLLKNEFSNNYIFVFPQFGSGLAGGQWPVIQAMVKETIAQNNNCVEIVYYGG